jgi:hypothetical protein
MSNALKQSKPAPEMIKFTADCFKVVGTKKVWTVSAPTGYGYPRKFYSLAEAEANRHGTQVISEGEEQITERIKWF